MCTGKTQQPQVAYMVRILCFPGIPVKKKKKPNRSPKLFLQMDVAVVPTSVTTATKVPPWTPTLGRVALRKGVPWLKGIRFSPESQYCN